MKRDHDLVLAFALILSCVSPLHATTDLAPGRADTRHHLESCTKWSEENGSFGFTNVCPQPVALMFVELAGMRPFDRMIEPNARFDTGLSAAMINTTEWLYTACPVGYAPAVPFTAENRVRIARGRYECVPR
jgi:hypothetical protein